jgi:cytochrome c-type biogenesis protein CcmF
MNINASTGNIFIIVSLLLSLAAVTSAIAAAAGKELRFLPYRPLYLAAGAGIYVSVIVLFYFFIICDFRFLYVYSNASRDLPLAYRIAAFWAGKEGSLLLWLFFLHLFGVLIINRKDGYAPLVSSVVLISQIFLLIILIVESPFMYIWDKYPDHFGPGMFPADGAGLNPLLKDPWMVIHPPLLFLGYASSTIPFGYAVAALLKKEFRSWINDAYPWLIFSMVTLGIGIFLGGYWAYSVLGWGGYWGWDPVENSSLIPWLVSIALVHGTIIQKRSGGLARLNIFLALFYFIMVFYSTWLTRSGVLSNFSVHSFAASEIATYLLAFLLIYTAGALVLYGARVREINGPKLDTGVFDWRTLAVFGIIVLMAYSFIILAGTSMPIISGLFMERPSNVTETFYNNFSRPLGAIILILMAASTTLIITRRENLINKENIAAAVLSVILGIAINLGHTGSPAAYLISILSIFLVVRSLFDLRKTNIRASLPSRMTHIGVGLLVLGIITSNFHTSSAQKRLELGKETEIGSLRVVFTGFTKGRESFLRFTVKNGQSTTFAKTAYYFDEKTESIYKEPYIIPGILNDIYIAPENYSSGVESLTVLLVGKGEEKEIGGLKIRFIGFRTEHMTSGEPSTYADLTVNGTSVTPGIKFTRAGIQYLDRAIPGTDRSVSLREIDANSKKILLNVSPGKNTAIPADTVHITVTRKRLIWLVWLGTILIAAGGCFALGRTVKGKD